MTNETGKLRERTRRALEDARYSVESLWSGLTATPPRKAVLKLCDALDALNERVSRLEDRAETTG